MSLRLLSAVSRLLASLVVALLLASCANDMRREPLSEKPRVANLNALSIPKNVIGLEAEGADTGDDIISTNGRPVFVPTALEDSDPLPKYNVPWMSFVDAPLQDVLQSVIMDSHVPLSIVWESASAKVNRSSIYMANLSGDLKKVLDKLAESYGFYWRYKEGMLHISADRQYITAVPPIADLFESLPIMIKTLGATDVFLDKSSRMITFRAGSQAFARIKNYLEYTRKERALIVYDTYIWEVILNDDSKMGVDWNALPGEAASTAIRLGPQLTLPNASNSLSAGLVNIESGGTGLALSFAGSRLSMNVLVEFLKSQGTINSLSQPKIQLLSGGKASLKDEIATTYVSRVGTSTVTAGAIVPGSVETSEVKTGVSLEVTGDVSDGTVYSDIALRVADLVGMNAATISGNTISLPTTSSREVFTHVRVKPGDTILLAGIQYDKLRGAGKTSFGLMRSDHNEVQRSELVVVMKPRIKRFIAKSELENAVSGFPVSAPVSAPSAERNAQAQLMPLAESAVPSLAPPPAPPRTSTKEPIARNSQDTKAPPATPVPEATRKPRTEPRTELRIEPQADAPVSLTPASALSLANLANVQPVARAEIRTTSLVRVPNSIAEPVQREPQSQSPTQTLMRQPIPAFPSTRASTGFYLQLGAFGSLENAQNFLIELTSPLHWISRTGQGLLLISSERGDGSGLHRVQAGPYSTRKSAQNSAQRVRESTGTEPALVRY